MSSGTAYGGLVGWIVETLGYAVAGIVAGAVATPVGGYVISPLWTAIKKILPGAKAPRA